MTKHSFYYVADMDSEIGQGYVDPHHVDGLDKETVERFFTINDSSLADTLFLSTIASRCPTGISSPTELVRWRRKHRIKLKQLMKDAL